jgi:hypothetical protein
MSVVALREFLVDIHLGSKTMDDYDSFKSKFLLLGFSKRTVSGYFSKGSRHKEEGFMLVLSRSNLIENNYQNASTAIH